MNLFNETLSTISGSNKELEDLAKKFIDNLSKPIGSLGILEDIVIKLYGMKKEPVKRINKKSIIIMCGDNGVVEEKVSACPQEVTAIVTENFTKGTTGVCALTKYYGSDLTIVDIGVKKEINSPKVINKKIRYGTRNMMIEAAMTREETIKAIETGIEITRELVSKGYDLLGTGEMGIGNTSTSAAVLSVLLDIDSENIVGMGAGLTKEQHNHKKNVIKRSIEVNEPNKNDVIDVLSKVGGFDIAGLCGAFLGAASMKVPIVIDGFISSVAALCAYRLNHKVRDYIFPSHISEEPGARYIMEEMKLEPMVNLRMRLGEGSGCPFAFNIIESALYTIHNMASFSEAGVIKDDYVDIREGK